MSMFSFYYDQESSPESGDEGIEGLGVYDEGTFYYESRSSTPTPPEPLPPAVLRMPFELWELIFGFVAPNLRDDGYPSLNDLLKCALTCRLWAYTAIPMLYRTHGYGVLMPSKRRDPSSSYFPISRSIDFYSTKADRKMMKLWRTLLLSCFTVSSNSESSNATLFPYINYVSHLDARTLVMVLTEIMKSQRLGGKSVLGIKAVGYFFGGLLGGFEISGATRGDRMIVGGSEYDSKSPVFGKDIKIFVGDTALMIMDFLYPHIHHLKGFTIPELGQLRTHEPVRMSHPISLLCSLQNLSRLVISSGWMVCPELGKAIASIRPTLVNRSFSRPGRQKVKADTFCLTILDWRFKTHYDPSYGHGEDWETDRSGYGWTVGSLERFFDALNPNSVTSLDLDFDIRYSRFPGKDHRGGPIVLSQSGSFKALRLARMRCSNFKLWRMLVDMGTAGFVPQALKLVDLIIEDSSADSGIFPGWSFTPSFWRDLRSLELSRFGEIFPFVSEVVEVKTLNNFDDSYSRRSSIGFLNVELRDLTLSYEDKHLGSEESYMPFFTHLLPSLGPGLTSLKLLDIDLKLGAQARAGTIRYSRGTVLPRSPLESLTNLKTLVLVGDVSVWLLSDRTREIMRTVRTTITEVDICISTKDLRDSNLSKIFSPCEKLQRLILRAWDKIIQVGQQQAPPNNQQATSPELWIEYPPLLTNARFFHTSLWPIYPRLTAQGVRHYLKKCKRGAGSKSSRTVLKEFGFSKAFCSDASSKSWTEVRDFMRHRGGKFLPKLDMESDGQHKAWDEGIPLPE